MTKRFQHSIHLPIINHPYMLSIAHKIFIINYRPRVRFQAVSVQGVKISPCILHHFVVLAPGNPQEQSQMNTNMSHAKITCHTVSDRYLNSYIEWLQLWNS